MRKSPLAVLFLTVFLDLVGFGIVIPLLPFYAESFLPGESPRTVGLLVGVLMASYSLTQFVFAPLWGRLSDRIGRRRVILVSVAGSAVSLTAFGFANSFAALLLARTLAGAAGANIAAAQAYVADVTTRENRAKGMGVIGAAFGLGFIFGPAIGGFFGQWGFALPAFVAAGLAVVNLALAFFLLPEPARERRERAPSRAWRAFDPAAVRSLLTRPALFGLVMLGFVTTTAFAMMESAFGLWSGRTHGFDQTSTGYLFAYLGVIIAVVQGGLIGPLSKRFGERRLLLTGLAAMGGALALVPSSLSLAALFAVMGLLALGSGLANPSLSALLSLEAGVDEQGATLGLAQSLSALARVLGPLYGGFAFGTFGIGAPFWSGAVVMAVALIIALTVLARLRAPDGVGERGAEVAP